MVTAYTLTCALGTGINAIRTAIAGEQQGLAHMRWPTSNISSWLGRVKELDTNPPQLAANVESRNNQLAKLGLSQDGFSAHVAEVIERYGAHRCGLILGTSTSSIGRTEESYQRLTAEGRFVDSDRHENLHNPHSTGEFVARELGILGPAITISTACSSSARAFASAARWLECGIADAVIAAGVDSLCLSVIHGFNSLQLIAPEPCRPFDPERSGLSLGEAAGFALLVRADKSSPQDVIKLMGYGESLDAYHMSSAHPEGRGAKLAMQAAADRAGIALQKIDYLNLHGTGTRTNDAIEGLACAGLLHSRTLCSSTKGWTGHTLGAAGITEAVLCMESLHTGLVPGTLNTRSSDPDTHMSVLLGNRQCDPAWVMSNSFGFGGNNCSLIFSRGDA